MSDSLQEQLFFGSQLANCANFEEILKCFICLGRVVDAKMCPSCSKLCCYTCIVKWLTEQRSQCPHCRSPLRPQNLVSCRIVAEISQALESLQVAKPDPIEKCSVHSAPLNYFCTTCSLAICSDCAMFGLEHKGHEFKHLSPVYDKHVEVIKQEAQGLRKKLKDLKGILETIDQNIDKVKKNKEAKCTELIQYVGTLKDKLEMQLQTKIQKLNEHRDILCEEIDNLENIKNEIGKQVEQSCKSKLISKSPEIMNILKEIKNKPIIDFQNENVSVEFTSEISPTYDSGIFEITNFSRLRVTTEVVYSDLLQTCGISWRLKVYPNGNGVARNHYISVFLEMVKGPQDTNNYEYRVEMVNHADPNMCVVREFASDFESGECWGYNKFFKIDLLKEEGYLSKNDSVLLRYYVRAPTYFQKCKEQKQYIEYLEANKAQLQAKLEEYQKLENKEPKASVFSSCDNPLETLEEELKTENTVDEQAFNWMKYESDHSEEELSLSEKLKKLVKMRHEEKKFREEEISKEQSVAPAHTLSTVMQKYMMSPGDMSSGSDTPRQLRWTEETEVQELHSCSELLPQDFLDSPGENQNWELSDGQLTPDVLG